MAKRKDKQKYPYRPDYATPPGYVLQDHIEAKGLTPIEFARQHSISAELIEGIIAGEAPIDPELAAIFGSEFSLEASFWLRVEATYRRRLAEREATEAAN